MQSDLDGGARSGGGLVPGRVLEGKFRVERVIGEGAMGLVVEATHLALDERVALKFLRDEARERPDIVARFAREARSAAKIKNDHVARVYDVGGTDDGVPFIVMEYLDGDDLEEVLLARGRLEPAEAVEYVIQACEGLAAAHASGIVHRDVKPANLFIAESAGVRGIKIVDFGISKAGLASDDINIASANTTQLMGSPHYMSPEQVRSTKDVDRRADIWSLGVVLFELLTAETPFTATELTAIIAQILHDPPRTVRQLRPELPHGLELVVQRCLEKDPAARFQTAADLAVALLPFAPKRSRATAERASAMMRRESGIFEEPPDSVPPPRMAGTTATTATTLVGRESIASSPVTAVAPSATEPTRKIPARWIAAAALLLLGGVGVVLFTTKKPDPPPSAAVAPPAPTPSVAPSEPPPSVAAAEATAAPAPRAPASPAATPPVPPRAIPRPPAPLKPSAAPPTVTHGENEIRHER